MRSVLPYESSLDGVRALCLIAVMLFHSGFSWAQGGYLGVSTFFTLSGFLITSLLLNDVESRGRVDFAAFFSRRLRRLLPASLLTLFTIAVTAPLWVAAGRLERLALDVAASLAYVVNWRFIGEDYAYVLLFEHPSEVQHVWSLAIEGQFYLVFPFVVAAFARGQANTRRLGFALVAGAAGSLALSAGLYEVIGRERVYFGTDTRIAELLIGGVLACVVRRHPVVGWRSARALDVVGVASLLALGVAWCALGLDTPALYRGGLGVYATASALVLLACLKGAGAVRRLLSPAPLRALGRISYGAYLYHWPIFLVVSPDGLGEFATFVLRATLTVAVAAASSRIIEEPIRRGRWLAGARTPVLAMAGTVFVAVVLIVQAPGAFAPAPVPRGADTPSRADADALRLAGFGDSTAYSIMPGYAAWMRTRPELQPVRGVTRVGCGLLRSTLAERRTSVAGDRLAKRCLIFLRDVRDVVARGRPHVSVVFFGVWEVMGVRLEGSGGVPRQLGEPDVDSAMRAAISGFVDILTAYDGHVVWLDMPAIDEPGRSVFTVEEQNLARLRFNELLREAAARRPEMTVLAFGGYLARQPDGPRALRPDGRHFTHEGAVRLVDDWLGPRTLEVLRRRGAIAADSAGERDRRQGVR